ncbi:ArsR/SmtB family transcription factor [Nonomuraea rubra]|uniref:ArsR/SmtB family transcription factor n=1 Tax=Nonomuraea rubra TaxID=46180 RepID=UPI00361543F5
MERAARELHAEALPLDLAQPHRPCHDHRRPRRPPARAARALAQGDQLAGRPARPRGRTAAVGSRHVHRTGQPRAELPVSGDFSIQAQIGALHDLPGEALVEDLERTFGPGPLPAHWRAAAERPTRWLRGYAGALADVWSTTEPLWKRARPLLDREVERVGVTTVRGGPELLLGAISDRIVYGERGLLLPGPEAGTHELGDRRIVLVPMLAGRDALVLGLDDPGAVWIAYPVPGAESMWRKPVAPALDELSALVGPVRADLLCALDQPMTMSMLATDMKIAPSGLTYHCDRLRAGRLITRERRGREVWIARTHRAEELLELFRR